MSAMNRNLTCALVQPDTRWADREANRRHLAELMDAVDVVDLIVLPETCTTGFLGDQEAVDGVDGSADLDWLRDQAARRGSTLACSVVAEHREGPVNRFVLIHPSGRALFYDKRHRFRFGGEGDGYVSGSRRQRTGLHGWRLDLQVCYDLRFPVWCRNDDAFEVQIFVANWPRPRIAHWTTLLRARAIENQAFVIGVNRVGEDGNGVDHPGASAVYDPLGEALVGPLDESEQVVQFTLEASRLQEIRTTFPFLPDRDPFSIIY